MAKILIIEDDSWIYNPLNLYFTQSWFDVKICDNWTESIDVFTSYNPDIIILDINLPGKNGFIIAQEIRQLSNTPIIMLSARWKEEDKVAALDLWADDYVSKPFSPRELLARVNSVLKRYWVENNKNQEYLSFSDINMDLHNFTLYINDNEIKVTKTEFQLLKYLIENKDWVILREKIMKDIMWYDNYLYDRTIDTHIKNLRKKLWNSINIETIRWLWYKVS